MQTRMFTPSGERVRIGTVHLYIGDWRDVADMWPRDAVLVTDPPYGIAYESNWSQAYDRIRAPVRDERKLARSIASDTDTSERDAVLVRGWKAAAVFGPSRIDRIAPWGDPRHVLTWDKGEGSGMGDLSFPWRPNTETISIYGDGWAGKRTSSVLRGAVMSFSRETSSNGRHHPHEKPLNVVGEIIEKAPPGPVVDPFAGGGAILLAAAVQGRDAWGAEIDPQYMDVILGRLATAGVPSLVITPAAAPSPTCPARPCSNKTR